MKKFTTRMMAMTVILLLLVPMMAQADPGDVGTPAIDFTLMEQGGSSFTLSDHLGKVVVVFVIGYG